MQANAAIKPWRVLVLRERAFASRLGDVSRERAQVGALLSWMRQGPPAGRRANHWTHLDGGRTTTGARYQEGGLAARQSVESTSAPPRPRHRAGVTQQAPAGAAPALPLHGASGAIAAAESAYCSIVFPLTPFPSGSSVRLQQSPEVGGRFAAEVAPPRTRFDGISRAEAPHHLGDACYAGSFEHDGAWLGSRSSSAQLSQLSEIQGQVR
jgi:hypothetical protein